MMLLKSTTLIWSKYENMIVHSNATNLQIDMIDVMHQINMSY